MSVMEAFIWGVIFGVTLLVAAVIAVGTWALSVARRQGMLKDPAG